MKQILNVQFDKLTNAYKLHKHHPNLRIQDLPQLCSNFSRSCATLTWLQATTSILELQMHFWLFKTFVSVRLYNMHSSVSGFWLFSIMIWKFIQVVAWTSSILSLTDYCSIIGIPTFVYPFTATWTFGLFSV